MWLTLLLRIPGSTPVAARLWRNEGSLNDICWKSAVKVAMKQAVSDPESWSNVRPADSKDS
jgi:hypothetical protein